MSFTPGPWFYRTSGDGFIIRSKTAIGPIAGVNGFRPIGEAEANAHRIVTAVNAFDDMKAALKDAADFVQPFNHASELFEKIESALSKAEGHIGQELAPDPERRMNGNANGDEG